MHRSTAFRLLFLWFLLQYRGATHPDLTQLHLDLFGDDVGPIIFSEEVPENSSQESVDPELRLIGLL